MKKEFTIMPYTEIDGIRTFEDSTIIGIYDRIIEEGNGHIFQDGSIPDSKTFLRTMKGPDTNLYIAYHEKTPVMVAWINRFESKIARVNWCPLSGPSALIKLRAGKYIIDRLLKMTDQDGNPIFDLIIGYTPSANKKAIRFIKLGGGQIVGGEVPNLVFNTQTGKSEPGIISYYARAT